MKYTYQKLDIGESPHLYAKHKFPGYRYFDSSTDRDFMDRQVNILSKRKYATLLLEDIQGIYYLFGKK